MQVTQPQASPPRVFSRPVSRAWRAVSRFWASQKYMMLMCFPFVVWVIIFKYFPLWGWTMSLQEYRPGVSFSEQEWVGLENFKDLFQDKLFYLVMRNTLAMSLLSLLFGFTLPIVLAILLNEIKFTAFKRTVQTISYLPHFVSWVVVASLFYKMLGSDGAVNNILAALHIIDADKPIQFMGKPELFWGIVTAADVWKEIGWNSILFLASITAISPELYESAMVDGAGRFRKIWHITLPGILPVVMVVLVMNVGNLINIGLERQFLMKNNMVLDYARVIDMYILDTIGASKFGLGTAAGIFKSVVSIVLLFIVNSASRKLTGVGIIEKSGGAAR